jgi:hypothetical protein
MGAGRKDRAEEMSESYQTAGTVFGHALPLADPAERAAHLDRACVGNPARREEGEPLQRAHEPAGDFLRPTVKLSVMNHVWLKELVAYNPEALRHPVTPTGEKPDDRRMVRTADPAEVQEFLLKYLIPGRLVDQSGKGWKYAQTERAWETSMELQPDPTRSRSRRWPVGPKQSR